MTGAALAQVPPASETVTAAPPSQERYLQYGVGLAAEGVVSAGPACNGAGSQNCILGSGGGLTVRVGWRPANVFYVGGVYEMSKQDPNQLYRLGILQQARVEGRRFFPTGKEVSPFVLLGAGVAGYGDTFGIDTWGGTGTLGGGLEVELGGPVLELSLAYRAMYLQAWVDSSNTSHDAGIAHFLGLEVSIEAKDRL
ncbi:MAG TPA: hypothetical protein VF765_28365 [Polyangiaceae bacterium]